VHAQLLQSEFVGSLAGTFDVRIPLRGGEFDVDLGLAVRNVDFYWPTYDVQITDITGPVSISLSQGVHSSGLNGRFLTSPIQLQLTTQPLTGGGWRFEMPAEGAVHSDTLLTWLNLSHLATNSGQSMPYQGRLLVSPERSTFEIDAEIKDLVLNTPIPMQSESDELSLKIDFEPQTRNFLLRWPGLIVADVRTFADGYPIDGHIALGQARSRARPAQGVTVELVTESFNVEGWQTFLANWSEAPIASGHEAQPWRPMLQSLSQWNVRELTLSTDSVSTWPFLADGIHLRLLRESGAWQGDFTMARALGSAWIADALDQPSRLRFQRLILGDPEQYNRPPEEPELPELRVYPVYDPVTDPLAGFQTHWLPQLAVSIHEFEYNGESLGAWNLRLRPEPRQLRVTDIRGTWRQVDVTGEVIWQTPVNGWHESQAELTLTAGNLADVLMAAKLSPVITSRRAESQLSLSWPGSPAASNRYRWQGDARFDLWDGSVLELEDLEAVRLIGLLNVTRIYRRLALDFQDVFGAGISYDRIRGHLVFDDGLVSVGDRLTLQGSGARMFFEGDYQMLRDQLDAEGVMVARVSNTAGLLAIGAGFAPPLALAIILGERALEREIERLFSIRTTITGSLTQPVVQSRRLFDGDIRGADTTFQERLRELFGPDQRTESRP
jgi:uncharacterized protein YhdP